MKHGGRLLVLLGALATGCGSSDDSAAGSSFDYGGQTGSLIPSCGEIPSLDQGLSVPSGDSAFVIYTGPCGSGLSANDITVLGADGTPIAFDLEPLADGAALVRTAETLVPGQYEVSTPDATDRLVVAEPEPVPVALGTAYVVDASGCTVTIDLQLDPSVVPYASLMSLDVSVDGDAATPWFEFGSLDAEDGTARLRLEHCDPVCFEPGQHVLTLIATIAGETLQPEPVEISTNVDCSVQLPPDSGGGGGCAMTRTAMHDAPDSALAMVAALLAALGIQRKQQR